MKLIQPDDLIATASLHGASCLCESEGVHYLLHLAIVSCTALSYFVHMARMQNAHAPV